MRTNGLFFLLYSLLTIVETLIVFELGKGELILHSLLGNGLSLLGTCLLSLPIFQTAEKKALMILAIFCLAPIYALSFQSKIAYIGGLMCPLVTFFLVGRPLERDSGSKQ